MNNKELQLINEVLNNKNQIEEDGVKYIYVSDTDIYRCDNNGMKKLSATVLKRALKLNQPKKAPTRRTGKQQQQIPQSEDVLDDEEGIPTNEESEQVETPEPEPEIKPKQTQSRRKARSEGVERKNDMKFNNYDIDLNEYYNTKNRMEFMSQELERYKNKVNKLKQYKNIVARINCGEYNPQYEEITEQQPQAQQMPQQQIYRGRNEDLFMF